MPQTYTGICEDLDIFLKDVADSWRTSMRAKDRHRANTILQLALAAIPRRSGRVTKWLGPSYFDEVLPIVAGARVRILRGSDPATFRNAYKTTRLIKATVNIVGAEDVEVTVREKFGLRVVIRNTTGAEQVLECGQLRRFVNNPHTSRKSRDDPFTTQLYHAWNGKQVGRIKDSRQSSICATRCG